MASTSLPLLTLAGGAGCGKSTIARELAAEIPGLAVIHLDDCYHDDREEGHRVTLYALDPNQDPELPSTIEPMDHGWSHLVDAVALWRLVDERQANALKDFLVHTGENLEGHPCWPPEQVRQLVDLLSGLEEALRAAGIMDEEWLTPLDKVPELARRVDSMDVRPERTDVELQFALAEVVMRARAVRIFLTNAAEAGFDVELS